LGIISLINLNLAYVISIPYNLLLEVLIFSTKLTSIGPLCEIIVPTPNIILIVLYYLILFTILLYLHLIKEEKFFCKEIYNKYREFKKSN